MTSRCMASGRLPGLVVTARAGALAALERVTRRAVGEAGAGQVGDVGLLPIAHRPVARAWRHVDHVVQPGMPLGRHLRGLGLAVIEHPAPDLLGVARTLLLEIAVAEGVLADRGAAPPREQPGSERHALRPA